MDSLAVNPPVCDTAVVMSRAATRSVGILSPGNKDGATAIADPPVGAAGLRH